MTPRIVRLEPHSMALFFKIDSDPGFGLKLCSDVSLFAAVHSAMFTRAPDDDSRAEVADVVAKLRDDGNVGFEDGWISLRTGMADVTALLMEKVAEAKEEERWADNQRFEEHKRRDAAETKYAALCHALREALGDRATEIAGKAA